MKNKGTRGERELFHLLWNTKEWGVLRSAGSGSTPMPSPDLLASNGKRYLAIECKVIGNTNKFFSEEEIQQLLEFSNKFGAEPWIAIKFDYIGWYFLQPKQINKTKKGYSITLDLAKEKGIQLKDLLKCQTL